jgi:hypothetical protein
MAARQKGNDFEIAKEPIKTTHLTEEGIFSKGEYRSERAAALFLRIG